MITVYNPNNYAQETFLRMAYNDLKGLGKLTQAEIDAQGFKSIHNYFAHMGDLIEHKTVYALIPSDESPFEINANTRTIKIPAEFNKCASVVGDDMCEIITFTIDRYFDYVDLTDTDIAIQWKTNQEEGMSLIKLVDIKTLESEGKIRFGWPITKVLTKNAGNITFSVRFFKRDNAEKIVYVLNTLPASFTVKESLNLNPEGLKIEEDVTSIFSSFVENSNNPSYATPMTPSFERSVGGLNLPAAAAIDLETNTLNLNARAITSDGSAVQHIWFFKENATNVLDPVMPINLTRTIGDSSPWEIKANYDLIDTTANIKAAKRENQIPYFYLDATLNYVSIGDISAWFANEENAEVALYAKNECLFFKNNEEVLENNICGVYYVSASSSFADDAEEEVVWTPTEDELANILINNEKMDDLTSITYVVSNKNTSHKSISQGCCVFPPNDVVVTSKFNDTVFMSEGGAQMTVDVAQDKRNPDYSYQWYKYSSAVEEPALENGQWNTDVNNFSILTESNEKQYSITEPGWYFCKAKAILNRNTKSADTNVCRIVQDPIEPVVEDLRYQVNNGEEQDYIADINGTEGEKITLKVVLKDDFSSKLISDQLVYTWYRGHEDNGNSYWKKIDPNTDVDPDNSQYMLSAFNDNAITVRVRNSDDRAQFYCSVENKLGNKSKVYTGLDAQGNVINSFSIM